LETETPDTVRHGSVSTAAGISLENEQRISFEYKLWIVIHRYDLALLGHGVVVLFYAVVETSRSGISAPVLLIAAGGAALAATRVHSVLTAGEQPARSERRTRAATGSLVLVLVGLAVSLVAPLV
jgi:hypothetical protein